MTPPGPFEIGKPRRKPSRLSPETLVRAAPLEPGGGLPLLIESTLAELELGDWAAGNRDAIEADLLRHGGILFRGFKPGGLPAFVSAVSTTPLEYNERSSPRSQVGKNVYTSTDYPADQSIFLHNENSYQQTWPRKIFFYCDTPAERGGETPIADCRKVYEFIPPAIRQRFEAVGWMYVRNFGGGVGLPWQAVFQTDDRAAVESYCLANGIEAEWLDGDRLRTRARRRAVVTHPDTHERLWFNHAAFFHVSTLEPAVREPLLVEFGEKNLPANSYYGDGTPIEPHVLDALREAYRRATVLFPWRRGDLLLLDNMLAAHGRMPFAGPRRILVSMAEPYSLDRGGED